MIYEYIGARVDRALVNLITQLFLDKVKIAGAGDKSPCCATLPIRGVFLHKHLIYLDLSLSCLKNFPEFKSPWKSPWMEYKIINILTKQVKYIIWRRISLYPDIVSLYQYFDINLDDQNNNLIYLFCKIYIELFPIRFWWFL